MSWIDYTYGRLCIYIYIYIYIQRSPVEIQTATDEPDQLQCDNPATCSIAQQNSSTTLHTYTYTFTDPISTQIRLDIEFVISHFHSCKEKLGTHLKNVILSFFLRITLNLKSRKSGSACICNDTSLVWSNQASHLDFLWNYELKSKCNKRITVLACYFNYCRLVLVNIVIAATEESWWLGSVSLRYVCPKYVHYCINRLLMMIIYCVIS
jgi:hypothetical protein